MGGKPAVKIRKSKRSNPTLARKFLTTSSQSDVSEDAISRVESLQSAYAEWDCSRAEVEKLLSEISALGKLAKHSNLPSKELLYRSLANLI